jgi:hypothetical protein
MKTKAVWNMKNFAIMALMLMFSVAAGYAQHNPVKMTSSGPEVVTAFDVQANTTTCDEKLAGDGSLGEFTYSGLRADWNNVSITNACPNGNLGVASGAGIFRFRDGSLMSVNITGGAICIDANQLGHLTETYQVTGGTGRFSNATGQLSHTATLNVVLLDASGNPLLLTHTGQFDGTILGVTEEPGGDDPQQ